MKGESSNRIDRLSITDIICHISILYKKEYTGISNVNYMFVSRVILQLNLGLNTYLLLIDISLNDF